MNDASQLTRVSHSANETRAIGAALAQAISRLRADASTDVTNNAPVVIALNGELGAGKTTFVGGFLCALGVSGAIRSPTYTLIEPYEFGERTIYHLDLYRLADARELEMLALRDLLLPGAVLLIEWAERGIGALPTPDVALTLRYPSDESGTDRLLLIQAGTITGKGLATSLQALADEQSVSS